MDGFSEADAPGACWVLLPWVCSWGFPGLLLGHDGGRLTGLSAGDLFMAWLPSFL